MSIKLRSITLQKAVTFRVAAEQSVGFLWTNDQLVAETSDNTQHSQQTNTHALGGIRTHNLSRRATEDLRLRPRGHWDLLIKKFTIKNCICFSYLA